MDYLSPYIPILVLLLITGVLCLAIGVGATLLGPRRITRIKESPFECGSPTTGDPHTGQWLGSVTSVAPATR